MNVSTETQCGQRNDDYCPVCDVWPRRTQPTPNRPETRSCLTCGQSWPDHGDHTPNEPEGEANAD